MCAAEKIPCMWGQDSLKEIKQTRDKMSTQKVERNDPKDVLRLIRVFHFGLCDHLKSSNVTFVISSKYVTGLFMDYKDPVIAHLTTVAPLADLQDT